MAMLRRSLLWLTAVLILAGCGQLESIPCSPRQTPQTWLSIQPFVELPIASRTLILVQPTTTVVVYFLGVVAIAAGLRFLRIRAGHRSRLWWGIALVLWGIGALLAGTSYEAFSYHIKCAGRQACIWTSWWEIGYLVVSVASVDAMLLAQAHACTTGRWRRNLTLYALFNLSAYVVTVLIGAVVPFQFLISFEWLLIVCAPTIALFIVLNGWRYHRFRRGMDIALLGAWAWLVLTMAAYLLYLVSGLTQRLWAEGYWFTENDVLHIGLILWMVYLAVVVAPLVEDEPSVQPPRRLASLG